jgi:hypothetical protein
MRYLIPVPPLGRFLRLGLLAAGLTLTLTTSQAALKDGLVAYWPLDEAVGTKTPDRVSGYDLDLVNVTGANLVPGRWGNAFRFTGSSSQYLKRVSAPADQLPINKHPALTVSLWAKADGTLAGNNDKRLFTEASNSGNNAPVLFISTANDGASANVDLFTRDADFNIVNAHPKGSLGGLDGTAWHHIVYVQQATGERAFYIDGVLDTFTPEIVSRSEAGWEVMNTTAIGATLRQTAGAFLTGDIDDVALWSRALTVAEIQEVKTNSLKSVFPPIANGMVAYWPLDEVIGTKTPDLVSGYDLDLVNVTAANLVSGRWGNAFRFTGSSSQYLKRVSAPADQLPINKHPALTVSLWAKADGTLAGNNDKRLFTEASNSGNNAPVLFISTANDGASANVDLFTRDADFNIVNAHPKGSLGGLDGTAWHHIVYVQQATGERAFYIDGVLDTFTPEIVSRSEAGWEVMNTTAIGATLRQTAGAFLTGDIDDVALWKRALTPAEIQQLHVQGTPAPFTKPQPLEIRSFKANFPAVAQGDSVVLSWDVTKNVQVEIDQSIGDVTSLTTAGAGSLAVSMPYSKTFTLRVVRGAESVTHTVTVAAVGQVAPGWTLLENFDRYAEGSLAGKGNWANLHYQAVDTAMIVVTNGNHFLTTSAGDVMGLLPLTGSNVVTEGQERTLFFRAFLRGYPMEAAHYLISLTEMSFLHGGENNIGLGAAFSTSAGLWNPDQTLPRIGVGGANGYNVGFVYPTVPEEPGLLPDVPYNFWIDIRNNPPPADNLNTGDTYTLWVAAEGDSARQLVVQDSYADRDPANVVSSTLNELVINARGGSGTEQIILFDDFYLSKSGILTTVPRVYGMTTPLPPPPTLSIGLAGGQIEIVWTGGTLESSTNLAVANSWSAVSGATTPYRPQPAVVGPRQFYRVRQ